MGHRLSVCNDAKDFVLEQIESYYRLKQRNNQYSYQYEQGNWCFELSSAFPDKEHVDSKGEHASETEY